MSQLIADNFVPALTHALTSMDSDSQFGLRGYLDHLVSQGFKIRKNREEEAISCALCMKLSDAGIPAFAEVRYPIRTPNQFVDEQYCDFVARAGDSKFLWVETKLLYQGSYETNDYLLWKPTINMAKTITSFLKDCKIKLGRLTQPEASYVGGLLISFECTNDRIQDKHIKRLHSDLETWETGHPNNEGIRWRSSTSKYKGEKEFWNRVWFWYREARVQ